jgi:hypothetical protein
MYWQTPKRSERPHIYYQTPQMLCLRWTHDIAQEIRSGFSHTIGITRQYKKAFTKPSSDIYEIWGDSDLLVQNLEPPLFQYEITYVNLSPIGHYHSLNLILTTIHSEAYNHLECTTVKSWTSVRQVRMVLWQSGV